VTLTNADRYYYCFRTKKLKMNEYVADGDEQRAARGEKKRRRGGEEEERNNKWGLGGRGSLRSTRSGHKRETSQSHPDRVSAATPPRGGASIESVTRG
jgi:hypothetical protein